MCVLYTIKYGTIEGCVYYVISVYYTQLHMVP